MRIGVRLVVTALILAGGWAAPSPPASAANLDNIADRVVGQQSFSTNASGNSGTSTFHAGSVALDAHGNLYVADNFNHRVLEFDAPIRTGAAANRVFGQPDFTSHAYNNGGVSANSLAFPEGLALDAHGNLYVADMGNARVLEYDDPLSTDTTADHVFGQPDFTTNEANAHGPSANSLWGPYNVALDAHGNLYVADAGNNRVLEYDDPLVTDRTADRVFGQPGFNSAAPDNGGISANSLDSPEGVAVDGQGNLYVADFGNDRVLEYDAPLSSGFTADRVFGQPDFASNFANEGGLSASSLWAPWQVALDAQDNLYVADAGNNRVLEYEAPLSTDATADHVFGQADFHSNDANDNGVGADGLNWPTGLVLDGYGNLYVADRFNNRVLRYDIPSAHGLPALTAISPSTVGLGSPSFTLTVRGNGFYTGSQVRWNGSSRPTLRVSSDELEATIAAADVLAGGPFTVTVFAPAPGGGVSNPILLDAYTRAGQDARADVVLGQPNFVSSLANAAVLAGGANRLSLSHGVVVDPHTGRVYVADLANNRVLSWPQAAAMANGQAADLVIGQPDFRQTYINNSGLRASTLYGPYSVALDAQGNLYVADASNNRVLEYDNPLISDTIADRVFGQPDFTHNAINHGQLGADSLAGPASVALDGHGNLYVADYGNNRVLEYDSPLSSDGTADRVFGQPDFTSNHSNDGGATTTSLHFPTSLALDAFGNLYVADQYNNRVLEYDTPLSTDTLADRVFGQLTLTGLSCNSPALNASSLCGPWGVTVDAQASRLYVSDSGNNRVLEYDAPLTSGSAARRVFGQPDFAHGGINTGGVQARSLWFPAGLALDAQNNLYVTDFENNRVLEYDWAVGRIQLPVLWR